MQIVSIVANKTPLNGSNEIISPIKMVSKYFFSLLLMLSLFRVILVTIYYKRVSLTENWHNILLQGIRVDITTLCIFLLFPVVLYLLCYKKTKYQAKIDFIFRVWLTIIVFILVFMEMATPSFMIEYNIRPNRIFVEYLIYPKEVFSMIIKTHWRELLVTNLVCIIASHFTWNSLIFKSANIDFKASNIVTRFSFSLIIFIIMSMGIRSTLGHRPLNPAMVFFSKDPLTNSIILNSTYSVGFALKQMLSERSLSYKYGSMPLPEVSKQIRKLKSQDALGIKTKDNRILSLHKATYSGKKKNLVIILQESLGARFVGSLGGLPLTPNLDRLSKEGWSFKSMFATGTRSVRGIEAVITGFTPTPDRAVIKLDKSQSEFYTIAKKLQTEGYHTEFIYGGEAHFDNMKSFFLGNGFDTIIEEKHFSDPKFVGSWGVSDEDLFEKAHSQFEEYSKTNKPFFSLVFSSSNHSPFEYPEHRIELYDKEINTRNNAIKYADWALGEFFRKAKKSNYWKNTIFLIVADHDARSEGNELVPPKSFHIPAVIIGSQKTTIVDHRIVSQLDLPVTMLSLIGVESIDPMIGQDLSNNNGSFEERAYMQYGDNFGYLQGDNLIVLQPEKAPIKYHFDRATFNLAYLGEADQNEYKPALAVALWGKIAYENKYHQ